MVILILVLTCGVDYDKLPLDRVFAFTESFEPHSDYTSSSEAAFQCGFGNKYYRISRNIRGWLVLLMEYLLNCYLHKIHYLKEIKNLYYVWILLQIPLPLTSAYATVNECARAIGPVDPSGLIKNYIWPGK